MKFDLHVHSHHSIDSTASYDAIYKAAKRRGLSGIAICDHNTFITPPECDGLIIIPSAEYTTNAGHILTFFLTSPIENKIRPEPDGRYNWHEVIDAAHEQGALAFLAHPYAPAVSRDNAVWEAVDGIEVFNARIEHSSIKDANQHAHSTCLFMKKPYCAGSDGHFPSEVGAAFWECDCEPTLDAVKAALLAADGKVYASTAHAVFRPFSQWVKMVRRKQWNLAFKIILRAIYAIIPSFCKKPRGYLNMKGR